MRLVADLTQGGSGAAGDDRGGGAAGVSNTRSVAEAMSKQLVSVASTDTVADAARLMRDHDIGPVLVMDGDQVKGIVTDRDITIRAVAEGRDVQSTPVSEVATASVTTVPVSDSLDQAAEVMRAEALRRVVIVDGNRPVGILSLGDLAQRDEAADDAGIALTDLSAAPPDR